MELPEDIRAEVKARLQQIAEEEGVTIFFACESGSRAWGFPSVDSDYDVRFLYLHPTDWYLSIDLEKKRDVIERPIIDVLDLSGWELRKALRLLCKSNPPLLEWLRSPMVYHESHTITEQLRALIPSYYAPTACFYHYLHMARGNHRAYLQGDEVWLKKYFYVLRPLLALQWIEHDRGVVPMEFEILVDQLVPEGSLKRAIADLLRAKRAGEELDRGPRIGPISDFVERELDRLSKERAASPKPQTPLEPLNALFRRALHEVWGDSR